MRHVMRSIAIGFACALPLAAQPQSGSADSARAAAIVARYISALGGEAALRSVTQYHAVMTTSVTGGPAGVAEVRQEIFAKAPNLLYLKMNMPGIGMMEIGFDGKQAWSNSAAAGPMIMDEVPRNVAEMAHVGALPLAGATISYVGRREIGGVTYDAVRAVFPDSQVGTHYFDVKTGLLSGMDPEGAPPPPAGRMTVTFSDYRRFGRVLQYTTLTTVMQGQEMVVRTESLSHAPLDPKIFDIPPAVRQLRDKQPPR